MKLKSRGFLFLIFGLSGFSGLIFESIWSHYLKLFLGHAAFAQTLVLAVFMVGMAIGSWVCSRYSVRWKNLLLGYALTEGAIGLFGLFFHEAFDQITQLAFARMIPMLGSAAMVDLFKWSLAVMMIMPQSILLGMTFPLMSAGIIRRFPDHPGRSLAMLYFVNSLGAAIGVLASGFILIGWVGLPGTIRIAGVINILLAAVVLSLAENHPPLSGLQSEDRGTGAHVGAGRRFLLTVSLLTGAASFMYEIGWIRMLNLVLGSSTHAFELMLSAFILGLALGGLWIRNRIDRINNVTGFLGFVQLIMGLLALSTLLVYGHTFVVMKWILNGLSKTDFGYTVFNLVSHLTAMSIMLPATFLAGMTLPLITYALFRQGHGEKSIGAVYSTNTIGAILGVFIAVHFAMPQLGLKGLISLGAALEIALGLILIWRAYASKSRPIFIASGAVGIGALAATLLWVHLDPYKMASGVYRVGRLLDPDADKILYHRDGRTATINLVQQADGSVTIRTNGKVDTSIDLSPRIKGSQDESNNVLLAAVPMTIYPRAKTAAVIGFGSGLTAHILMSAHLLERLDTVEIEPAVIEASLGFGARVARAYGDSRSRIHIGDARTYFSTHNRKYDLIVSEPSDPWVSGISGLFSKEFYHRIKSSLNPGGLLVQWLQVYEIDVELVASVLKALSLSFSDYVIYASTNSDLVIIARDGGSIPDPEDGVISLPGLAQELSRVDIQNIQDVELRKIGHKKVLDPLFATFSIEPNSDYFPVLDLKAVRTRFMELNANDLMTLGYSPIPVVEMLDVPGRRWETTDVSGTPYFFKAQSAHTAIALRDFYRTGSFGKREADLPAPVKQDAMVVGMFFRDCSLTQKSFFLDGLYDLSIKTTAYLTPEELDTLWGGFESGRCYSGLSGIQKDWVSLFKAVGERNAKTMARTAERLIKTDGTLQAHPVRFMYLLAASMLGHLAQGDRSESLRLWSQYSPEALKGSEPNLVLRLLLAHSIAPVIQGAHTSAP